MKMKRQPLKIDDIKVGDYICFELARVKRKEDRTKAPLKGWIKVTTIDKSKLYLYFKYCIYCYQKGVEIKKDYNICMNRDIKNMWYIINCFRMNKNEIAFYESQIALWVLNGKKDKV